MTSPATGPVHEHDEASAVLFLANCPPGPPGNPYLQVTKSSLESCLPTGQQSTGASPPDPCTFTVKVQAVGNFVGNVEFGDGVFTTPGGAPVPSLLSSVTLTPPPLPSTQTYCVSSFTTTAAPCTQSNVTLNNGQIITYTFTLAAPPNLAPGNYKKLFHGGAGLASGRTEEPVLLCRKCAALPVVHLGRLRCVHGAEPAASGGAADVRSEDDQGERRHLRLPLPEDDADIAGHVRLPEGYAAHRRQGLHA
ncbi:MAG: hypothetical protein WDM84_05805 [Bauldia sp.]